MHLYMPIGLLLGNNVTTCAVVAQLYNKQSPLIQELRLARQ